ncbi:hypothetical protein [Amycolatopsis panacis]|uniref:Uncharacterized protein n=1 Tax=Amycolatopsis panacis TaxID=2340917 RepID=A0A419I9V3_9PSEU|nr:hypothetical protein [Amycolatopsis panacis]RJQ89683.1 hypothetical protein D5S19_04365 [Amycolatopsis panacis]
MEKRDLNLFARLRRINTEFGEITLRPLTVQYEQEKYIEGPRLLGEAHTALGQELTERANELSKQLSQ